MAIWSPSMTSMNGHRIDPFAKNDHDVPLDLANPPAWSDVLLGLI
jgi:hypothetical protein